MSDDDLVALKPGARAALGDTILKAEVYDLEQAIQDEVAADLLTQVIEGHLMVDGLVNDSFLRELHGRLYGDVWTWAGVPRLRS